MESKSEVTRELLLKNKYEIWKQLGYTRADRRQNARDYKHKIWRQNSTFNKRKTDRQVASKFNMELEMKFGSIMNSNRLNKNIKLFQSRLYSQSLNPLVLEMDI
jgi:hypothetical protein